MDMSFPSELVLEMFIFESNQLIEQVEQSVISGEKCSEFTPPLVNEILRAMHTIKGSSAMMMFEGIATLSHELEDLFYFLRESKPKDVDYSTLSDYVLEGIDFIKLEIVKIRNGDKPDGNCEELKGKVQTFLEQLKNDNQVQTGKSTSNKKVEVTMTEKSDEAVDTQQKNAFKVVIHYSEGCEMENVRAYSVIHKMQDHADQIRYVPEDILDNEETAQVIRDEGLQIWFRSELTEQELLDFFEQTIYLKSLELTALNHYEANEQPQVNENKSDEAGNGVEVEVDPLVGSNSAPSVASTNTTQQRLISVNVTKLDKLMDLIGELVISEAMVTQNPELKELELDSFWKSARQLRKITGEIQDMVMSIRMVPLTATFTKMNRIVRDMCKKLEKEVELEIIGEETEVDKNIIEQISDPLMHLIRNAIDHGIEQPEERRAKGKNAAGKITLEAKNAGSDVMLIVKDDGMGLNKEKILQRAKMKDLLIKPEKEMTDKDIFSLIFLPGFSTNESVTEFSGRGVGMDVVTQNIEEVGGSVSVDSLEGVGSVIHIKIPLTLAIIDGMNIGVGRSRYTIPIMSIRESFRAKDEEVFTDPDGNEMMMVRGQCYPVMRLHEKYKVETEIIRVSEGIIIMVENENEVCCLFADELLGEQQVVVKALPDYIKNTRNIQGLAGCTLLGDGSISLILDISGLISGVKPRAS